MPPKIELGRPADLRRPSRSATPADSATRSPPISTSRRSGPTRSPTSSGSPSICHCSSSPVARSPPPACSSWRRRWRRPERAAATAPSSPPGRPARARLPVHAVFGAGPRRARRRGDQRPLRDPGDDPRHPRAWPGSGDGSHRPPHRPSPARWGDRDDRRAASGHPVTRPAVVYISFALAALLALIGVALSGRAPTPAGRRGRWRSRPPAVAGPSPVVGGGYALQRAYSDPSLSRSGPRDPPCPDRARSKGSRSASLGSWSTGGRLPHLPGVGARLENRVAYIGPVENEPFSCSARSRARFQQSTGGGGGAGCS